MAQGIPCNWRNNLAYTQLLYFFVRVKAKVSLRHLRSHDDWHDCFRYSTWGGTPMVKSGDLRCRLIGSSVACDKKDSSNTFFDYFYAIFSSIVSKCVLWHPIGNQ